MRIDNNNSSSVNTTAGSGTPRVRPPNEQAVTTAQPGKVAKSGDDVQFSSVASHVSAENLSINQSVSAERSARIEQLTKLVQSGQYHPDPQKIAESMVREMLTGSSSS